MKPSYGMTLADLELTPRQTSWQMLRALHHDPPHLARGDGAGARRALFSAALEQAEQLFRAAEATGTETRPLLLFYGLCQSGRALRAAADPDGEWHRSRGHGLAVNGTSVGAGLTSTIVKDQSHGLFRDVARILHGATLGTGQTVGLLCRVGHLGERFPMPGDEPDYSPLTLFERGLAGSSQPLRAELTVPADTWVCELPEVGVRTTDDHDAYKDHVRARLAHYPTLRGAELVDDVVGYFDLGGSGNDRTVALRWPDLTHPAPCDIDRALLPFGEGSGREVTVYPDIGGQDLAAHPYLLWWAVLCAMSHYVRYQPTAWAQIIDIDHSDEATAVEHLCGRAMDVLPELIHRTLTRDSSVEGLLTAAGGLQPASAR